jgi:hypothetical protein
MNERDGNRAEGDEQSDGGGNDCPKALHRVRSARHGEQSQEARFQQEPAEIDIDGHGRPSFPRESVRPAFHCH